MGFFNNLGRNISKFFKNLPKPFKFFKSPIQTLKQLQKTGLGRVTDEERFYARFAKEMYDLDRTENIAGYKLIPKFNLNNKCVWFNQAINRVVIAFRGTEDLSEDLIPDIAILTNTTRFITRFKEDTDYYKKVIQEFPTANFTLVGHSLSGHIVAYILREIPRGRGFTYNAGVGFGNADIFDNPRLNNVRTETDPISLLGAQYMKSVPAIVPNAHGIENFL